MLRSCVGQTRSDSRRLMQACAVSLPSGFLPSPSPPSRSDGSPPRASRAGPRCTLRAHCCSSEGSRLACEVRSGGSRCKGTRASGVACEQEQGQREAGALLCSLGHCASRSTRCEKDQFLGPGLSCAQMLPPAPAKKPASLGRWWSVTPGEGAWMDRERGIRLICTHVWYVREGEWPRRWLQKHCYLIGLKGNE